MPLQFKTLEVGFSGNCGQGRAELARKTLDGPLQVLVQPARCSSIISTEAEAGSKGQCMGEGMRPRLPVPPELHLQCLLSTAQTPL